MKIVRWIDVMPDSALPRSEDGERQTRPIADVAPTHRPTKRKVTETEPEPPHTVIPGTASELELLFSAKADYAKCQVSVNKVHFKDTLVFQTRMYR